MRKRVFISFAIEDERYRNLLVGQAAHERSPFDFVDMSVRQPWDSQWRAKCLTRIESCDAMIALVSANTARASGARYEIQCAIDLKMPLLPMYVDERRAFQLPPELAGKRISVWSWPNLKAFMARS